LLIEKIITDYAKLSNYYVLVCAETLEREMERVQAAASEMCGHHIPGLMPQLQAKGVVQAVKAVCALMGNVETQDITESVESFESVCLQFIPAPTTVIIDFLYYMLLCFDVFIYFITMGENSDRFLDLSLLDICQMVCQSGWLLCFMFERLWIHIVAWRLPVCLSFLWFLSIPAGVSWDISLNWLCC
jgi:hypothetical protein